MEALILFLSAISGIFLYGLVVIALIKYIISD
jgi:hypothetical protein